MHFVSCSAGSLSRTVRSHKCRGSIGILSHLPFPPNWCWMFLQGSTTVSFPGSGKAVTLCGEKMSNISWTLQFPWHETLSFFWGLRISIVFALYVLTITLPKGLKKSLPSCQVRLGAVTTHFFSRLELDMLLEMEMETSWSLGHSQLYQKFTWTHFVKI